MKIVRLSKDSNLTRIEKTFNWFRFSGRGPVGVDGTDGTNGTNGTDGTDGVGVPTGGTTAQILAKIDGDDFNTEWKDESAGVTDHGALTGLSDDDHNLYTNINGRSGGQDINLGLDSGDGGNIYGSAHATKGPVNINGNCSIAAGGNITVGGLTEIQGSGVETRFLRADINNTSLRFQNTKSFSNSDNVIEMADGTMTQGNGEHLNVVAIIPTYNQSGTASATDLLINRTETATGSGAQLFIDAAIGGVGQANMDNDGSWLNKLGVYGTISDEDLKQNIIEAGPQLADLMLMNFYNYELIGDDGIKLLGPLAQELEKIKAGLVTDTPHMITAPDLDWTPSPEEVEIIPAVMGDVQKTVDVTNKETRIEINLIDGQYIQQETTESITIQEPVFDEFPLYDESGKEIGLHRVPVMIYAEVKPEQRIIINEATTEADRPMIRKHDGLYIKTVKQSVFIWILCICMQEITKRLEAVEDAQKTLS